MTAKILRDPETYRQRILRNSVPDPDGSDCWVWVGGTVKARGGRYGRLSVRLDRSTPTQLMAHRVAFEAFNERPILGRNDVDHTCECKLCVNPHHLQQRTRRVHNRLTARRAKRRRRA